MRNQLVEITARGILWFNNRATPPALHEVGVVGDVEITFPFLTVVAT